MPVLPEKRVTSVLLAYALCTVAVAAQGAKGRLTKDFERRKTKVLVESGQRHLRIGSWARKAGLTPQATNEFLEAVRVSENRHPGPLRVLNLKRVFDDRFWLRERKRPSKRLLEAYAKRAAKAKQQNAADRMRLAGSGTEPWSSAARITLRISTDAWKRRARSDLRQRR